MQDFFLSHHILLLVLTGAIGFLVGIFIHKLAFSIPNTLQKNWRIQSWQFLYPESEIPTEIISIKIAQQTKYPLWLALLTAFLSMLIIHFLGLNWTALANLILMWGLLLLARIDFKYYLLPDCLTLPLLWLGLLCNTFELFTSTHEAIWGAMVGYTSLWFIATIFKYCRHREGLGQGDFKLLAALGAWSGIHALFFIVMIASFTGTTVGLIQMARGKHTLQKPMPFGPYLVFGAITMIFFGNFF